VAFIRGRIFRGSLFWEEFKVDTDPLGSACLISVTFQFDPSTNPVFLQANGLVLRIRHKLVTAQALLFSKDSNNGNLLKYAVTPLFISPQLDQFQPRQQLEVLHQTFWIAHMRLQLGQVEDLGQRARAVGPVERHVGG
jgi:hypothetical protein